jgi:hypothetical protein
MPYFPPKTSAAQVAEAGSNPFLMPPASPSVYDDEFFGGSPDLEARGWKFRDMAAPSVAMIRDGDIVPFYAFTASQVNPIAAGHYRSTIYGSVLFLQLPGVTAKTYLLYKPTPAMSATWPNGTVAWCRAARVGYINSLASPDGGISSELAYTTSGGTVWDDTNRIFTTTYNNSAGDNNTCDAGRVIAGTKGSGGTFSETPGTGTKYDIIGSYIFANASGVTTNTRHAAVFVDSGSLSGVTDDGLNRQSHALNPTLFTAYGVRLEGGSSVGTIQSTAAVPYAYALDFVRFFQGDITNKWIAG